MHYTVILPDWFLNIFAFRNPCLNAFNQIRTLNNCNLVLNNGRILKYERDYFDKKIFFFGFFRKVFFPYWFLGFYNERFFTKFDLCRLSIVQPRGYDLKLSRRRTMKIASMLRLMDSSIDWKL